MRDTFYIQRGFSKEEVAEGIFSIKTGDFTNKNTKNVAFTMDGETHAVVFNGNTWESAEITPDELNAIEWIAAVSDIPNLTVKNLINIGKFIWPRSQPSPYIMFPGRLADTVKEYKGIIDGGGYRGYFYV